MSVTPRPTITGSYLMPSLDHAAVSDVMRPGVLACDPESPLTEVARMMSTRHVHCVLVMQASDEGSEPAVWGMVSDLDLVRTSLRTGPETSAAACAQRPVLSVDSTTPLREAASIMGMNRVSHMLVTDPGTQRPTGVLSTLDVAGAIAWGEA